jgi:oligopeptide/dipeptide ABC transporter ATP-binding protein
MAPSSILFSNPSHPYTRALLQAAPMVDPRRRIKAPAITGEPPNPINIGVGCPFRPRCALAFDRCSQEDPQLKEIENGHFVSCFKMLS